LARCFCPLPLLAFALPSIERFLGNDRMIEAPVRAFGPASKHIRLDLRPSPRLAHRGIGKNIDETAKRLQRIRDGFVEAIGGEVERQAAVLAGVSHETVIAIEAARDSVKESTIGKVRAAFEAAGVIFLENGEGPSVKLRKVPGVLYASRIGTARTTNSNDGRSDRTLVGDRRGTVAQWFIPKHSVNFSVVAWIISLAVSALVVGVIALWPGRPASNSSPKIAGARAAAFSVICSST
jgi:hypothetical protein